MKKRLSLLLVCILIFSVVPTVGKASEIEESKDIYVEYLEYYDNEEYYVNLAKNYGYTIYIHVGEEHAEEEAARFGISEESLNKNGEEIEPRGLSIPTSLWDISSQGKDDIDGFSNSTPLYTEFKYYGITHYGVRLYNYSTTNTLTCVPSNFYEFGDTFTLEPRYSVLKFMTAYNTNTKVYLKFFAPCYVKGYIGSYDEISKL